MGSDAGDLRLLYAGAFLRALSTGMMGVLLGPALARLELSEATIGAIVACGLTGGATAALVVTLRADRIGRRGALVALGVLGALGTWLGCTSDAPAVLGIAAFIGMWNGMGRERGAGAILEQSILPATASERSRTKAFAWYNVLQDAGHALGALFAGLPAFLRADAGLGEVDAVRGSLALYGALALAAGLCALRLSARVEAPQEKGAPSLRSRAIVRRLAGLFAVDSLAGGFLTTALLSYFFFERFGILEAELGLLFFAARVLNALSHLAAAELARRIGLVNTMVFTHVPSSVLLVTVAFAPSFPVAALLFLVREGLVEMDVPTRQSYVMAVVGPEERTYAAGITNLVRLAGWAAGPFLAGVFMHETSLAAPLFVGAGMKIAYDVLLYRSFKSVKPPEEG